ncbi:MAG: hypothetical protein ACFFC0_03200 [Promethearchaeota archaeon]
MQELELERHVEEIDETEEPYSAKMCRTVAVLVYFVSTLVFLLALNLARFITYDVVTQVAPYCWACILVTASWIAVKARSYFRDELD